MKIKNNNTLAFYYLHLVAVIFYLTPTVTLTIEEPVYPQDAVDEISLSEAGKSDNCAIDNTCHVRRECSDECSHEEKAPAEENDQQEEQTIVNENNEQKEDSQPEAAQPEEDEDGLLIIDTIKVIIGTESGTDIITLSELTRPGLEGNLRTKDELILERLMYQDALKFQPEPDEDKIDKQLQIIQRENNITLDQLKEIFKNAGYTFEEGRMQFAIMSAVSELLALKIRSRMTITEQEIQIYYDANPVPIPTTYYVERAFVPFNKIMTTEEQRTELKQLTPRKRAQLSWSRPFPVTQAELDEEKQFIIDIPLGEISEPNEIEDGFEIFKMVSVHDDMVVPLNERHEEIANILRKERYEKLMKEYTDSLKSNASIIEM